jgi:acyl transferase domain-containing protein
MGQYSAMVAAGVISLADAVRLVRERGRQMQASGQGRSGAMAAIIGLDDARIPEMLALGEPHGSVTVANRNSPGQIVISGDRAAVGSGSGRRQGTGCAAGHLLPVSVAAHSSLMAEAADGMSRVLARSPSRIPPFRSSPTPTPDRSRPPPVPVRADRAPDAWRRLGRSRRAHDRRRSNHLRRDRARQSPDGPDQAHSTGRNAVAVDDAAAPGGIAVPFDDGSAVTN